MKIQCDVCSKEEAAVFCTADDAALCDTCDHRVHHANKLASKHQRFSLLLPSSKNTPMCDVCQEKRAFLFCQQDRAILCRDCDAPIHSANEHTKKHNRFLLTGVKLSATSAPYISTTTKRGGDDLVPDSQKPQQQEQQPLTKKPAPVSVNNPPSIATTGLPGTNYEMVNKNGGGKNLVGNEGIGSATTTTTSSISEYLMETLPGWHVEDFLDLPSTPFGFSKSGGDGMLPFVETDFEGFSSSSESLGIWVPQAPNLAVHQSQSFWDQMGGGGGQRQTGFGLFKETKEGYTNLGKASSNRRSADAFTVPQISPTSTGTKRSSRPFWKKVSVKSFFSGHQEGAEN